MFCIWKTQDGVFVSHEKDEVVSKLVVAMAYVKQILLEINILDSPSLQDCTRQECESPNVTSLLKVDKLLSSYFPVTFHWLV